MADINAPRLTLKLPETLKSAPQGPISPDSVPLSQRLPASAPLTLRLFKPRIPHHFQTPTVHFDPAGYVDRDKDVHYEEQIVLRWFPAWEDLVQFGKDVQERRIPAVTFKFTSIPLFRINHAMFI